MSQQLGAYLDVVKSNAIVTPRASSKCALGINNIRCEQVGLQLRHKRRLHQLAKEAR